MAHIDDKIMHCKGCDKDFIIPHNQAGGFWFLCGWTNPHGLEFWGGYCVKCFHALDKVTNTTGNK